jgi:hypothetical protein
MVLMHPPYSPDLAPTNFFSFRPLKNNLLEGSSTQILMFNMKCVLAIRVEPRLLQGDESSHLMVGQMY